MIVLSSDSGVHAQCACFEIGHDNYACCEQYQNPTGSGPNATGYLCPYGSYASQQTSPGECCANAIQGYTFSTGCKL